MLRRLRGALSRYHNLKVALKGCNLWAPVQWSDKWKIAWVGAHQNLAAAGLSMSKTNCVVSVWLNCSISHCSEVSRGMLRILCFPNHWHSSCTSQWLAHIQGHEAGPTLPIIVLLVCLVLQSYLHMHSLTLPETHTQCLLIYRVLAFAGVLSEYIWFPEQQPSV